MKKMSMASAKREKSEMPAGMMAHKAKAETHKQMMEHHKTKMDQHMAKLRAMKGR